MLTPSLLVAVPGPVAPLPAESRARLVRRGRVLAVLTLAATAIEASVGVGAGLAAGSVALLGFGADSIIEVTAAATAFWRLGRDADAAARARAERLALRIVGACFLLLAAYVAAEAVDALTHHRIPAHSGVGIALAIGSMLVMPLLSRAKRRVAAGLGSSALRAEAEQTALCAYLAAILLGGLLLHRAAGWWWADPLAALVMVPIIAKDGIDSFRGRGCADCGSACQHETNGPHAA